MICTAPPKLESLIIKRVYLLHMGQTLLFHVIKDSYEIYPFLLPLLDIWSMFASSINYDWILIQNYLYILLQTRGRISDALDKLSSCGLFMLTRTVQHMLLDCGYGDVICKASNGKIFICFMLIQAQILRTTQSNMQH